MEHEVIASDGESPKIVFNEELKNRYVTALSPERLEEQDIRDLFDNTDLGERGSFVDAQQPLLDGIAVLHRLLLLIDRENVVMIDIG